MFRYFTSFQIFTAAAVSLVLFVGLLWAESSNYQTLSQLYNPFSARQSLDERLVVTEKNPQTWLHGSGELFVAFPGTKVNFVNQARQLEEGSLYLDTNFVSQADTLTAREGFLAPFDLNTATPGVGQIRAGSVIVSVPQGIAAMRRDLIRQEVEVYAHDHPVDIFLPEADVPFLLPPGHVVLIKESRTDVLGSLHYTKLKKELKLAVFDQAAPRLEHFVVSLATGLIISEQWQEDISDYAQKVVLSLERFSPSSFMGRALQGLAFLQRYYAVGVGKAYKIDYQYHSLTTDLVKAYFAVKESQKAAAIEAAQRFLALLDSPEWARFYVEQPHFLHRWDEVARSQRVWMMYLFPEGLEADFLWRLWGPQPNLKNLADYHAHYYRFEKYQSEGLRGPAKAQLDALSLKFGKLSDLSPSDQSALTRARRQLSFQLQTEFSLQNEASVTLYTQLVKAEQGVLKNNVKLRQEIRLEVAQELLYFLKDSLDSVNRRDTAIILLKAYRDLKVAELYQTLGRTVFNQEENETLNRIQSLGTLDDEKLAAVRRTNAATAATLADINILGSPNTSNPPQEGNSGIKNENAFMKALEGAGVLTQGMNVHLVEDSGIERVVFSGATYEGYSLSGNFRFDRQSFGVLRLGDISENLATMGNLPAFLKRMTKQNKTLNPNTTTKPTTDLPNPSTGAAVLKRRLVLQRLGEQNMTVHIDNIIPLNQALTRLQVSEAIFNKQYSLNFLYDTDASQIESVEIQFGRSQLLLPNQVFNQANLSESLQAAIEEKLAEEAQNQDGA